MSLKVSKFKGLRGYTLIKSRCNKGVTSMKRGVTLIENCNNYPSHEDVKNIFNETYNVFYTKWRSISSPSDWPKLMHEARELNKKYDCELCSNMVIGLIKVIEDGFKEREVKDE